jgi:hypothetical protein
MPDDRDALSPATAEDLALVDALAFALRVQGRKRVHNADELGIRSGAVCAPSPFLPGLSAPAYYVLREICMPLRSSENMKPT